MKPRQSIRRLASCSALAAASVMMTAGQARATTLTWDPNGAAEGSGGDGTWDTTSFLWDGGLNTWPSSGTDNNALFGRSSGIVTLVSVAANDLTFNTTGYTLNGTTLSLSGTITTDTDVTATIGSVVQGSAGLMKTGPGTLVLGDTFTLFSNSGTRTGAFSSLTLPDLSPGLSWNLTQLNSLGTISVSSAVSAPTFNPPGGGYQGDQFVTVSSDAGSTIHYTMDGSDPLTSGTVATGISPVSDLMIPVDSTVTIKAYATKPGQGDSAVATSTYTTVTTPTWTHNSPGEISWLTAANWLGGAVPNSPGAIADFSTLTLSGNTTIHLNGFVTASQLTFGDVGNAFTWTLDQGSAGSLTLDGGSPTITVNNQTTTISAPLAGTQELIKAGSGTLALTGTIGYTGATTLSGGTLSIASPLPAGTLSLANNTVLQLNAGMTLPNNVVIPPGSTAKFTLNGAFNGNLSGDYSGVEGTLVLDITAGTSFSGFVIASANGPALGSVVKLIGTDDANHAQLGLNNSAYQAFFANTKVSVTATGTGKTYFGLGNSSASNVQFGALDGGNATTFVGFDNRTGTLTLNGTADGNFAGRIFNGDGSSGPLTLIKEGSATQTLTGSGSDYSGPTLVKGGTLILANATGFASTSITVNSGGTLSTTGTTTLTSTPSLVITEGGILDPDVLAVNSGTYIVPATQTLSGGGSVDGNLVLRGTASPGSGIGTLTATGKVTLDPNAKITYQIDGTWDSATADKISADHFQVDANTANKVVITLSPLTLTGFTETDKSFTLLEGTAASSGFTADSFLIDAAAFRAATGARGVWSLVESGTNILLVYTKFIGFEAWAAGFGLEGNDALMTADYDNDGIPNIIEFVTNGDPTVWSLENGPDATLDPSDLTFTFTRRDDSEYLNPVVEFSTSLDAGSWITAAPDNSSISVNEAGDAPDTVTVHIPRAGQTKLFVRLKVAIP